MRPDTSFLWFGERQLKIMSAVQIGVLAGNGLHLVTGDAGVGKSALLQILVDGLDKSVQYAVIDNPGSDTLFFFNAIAMGFGFEKEITSKVQFLIEFSDFLRKSDDAGSKVVLAIDNAQRLGQEMLEEVRMLSNIEKDSGKLLNILLVGRSKFTAILSQPRNKVIRQRLTFRADMKHFNLQETGEYILHRLKAAGTEQKIFTPAALQLIHKYSGGIPGRINTICEKLLVVGADEKLDEIEVDVVKDCIRQKGTVANDKEPGGKIKLRPGATENGETLSGEIQSRKNARVIGSSVALVAIKREGLRVLGVLKNRFVFVGGVGVLLLLLGSAYYFLSTPSTSDQVASKSRPVISKPVISKPAASKIIIPDLPEQPAKKSLLVATQPAPVVPVNPSLNKGTENGVVGEVVRKPGSRIIVRQLVVVQ